MPPRSARKSERPAKDVQWASRGVTALREGRFEDARAHLAEAIKADKRNPYYRFDLALAHQGVGAVQAAAHELCEALKSKPDFNDAARRLSQLVMRYVIEDETVLDPFALRSAMLSPTADHQPLSEVAISRLVKLGALGPALASLAQSGPEAAARELVVKRTGDLLKDDLFLAALEHGVNRNLPVERLLTALRRALLLEVPADRMEDRALQAFTLALARQCASNEHIWAVSEEERKALSGLAPDLGKLREGDLEAGRQLLLRALYRPLRELLPAGTGAQELAGVRPKALRDLVQHMLAEEEAEKAVAARIPRLGSITDATSAKVAAQYEALPYPRWTSLILPPGGAMRFGLRHFFPQERLAFLEKPFDVLVAGCGTGRQAIQAKLGYGGDARVLGIDLSARSLAYGQLQAERLGVTDGLSFAQCDLLDVARTGRAFDIVECVGVLHHLADPFAGWKALLEVLKPGGLMQIGLYSAVSRKALAALRKEPGYPGPGCSTDAALAYRQQLMQRPEDEGRVGVQVSQDAYTMSEFRDLVLHPSERHLELAEIERFLADNGLTFRGFMLPGTVLQQFTKAYPDSPGPGRLGDWALFEKDNPRTFDAMYRLWCDRL